MFDSGGCFAGLRGLPSGLRWRTQRRLRGTRQLHIYIYIIIHIHFTFSHAHIHTSVSTKYVHTFLVISTSTHTYVHACICYVCYIEPRYFPIEECGIVAGAKSGVLGVGFLRRHHWCHWGFQVWWSATNTAACPTREEQKSQNSRNTHEASCNNSYEKRNTQNPKPLCAIRSSCCEKS